VLQENSWTNLRKKHGKPHPQEIHGKRMENSEEKHGNP
jgi:hypothetical protein